MELVTIDTVLQRIEYTQALINFDNEPLMKMAKEITAKYTNLVVTEGSLPSITKEIAQLNNITKAIDEKRKEIKRGYNEPLKVFEDKIKEVTAIIESTVAGLKSQTEVFEQKRREDITVNLLVIIDEIVAEQGLDIKYKPQVIIQENYYNKTAKEKLVREDILRQVTLLKQAQELDELKAKQAAEEQERKRVELEAKIKARYELVETLNREHGFTFAAKDLEKYSDAELFSFYINEVKKRTTVEQAEPAKSVETPAEQPVAKASEVVADSIVSLVVTNISQAEAERIRNGVEKTFAHAKAIISANNIQVEIKNIVGDYDYGYLERQYLNLKLPNGKTIEFCQSSLAETPEDATLDRDINEPRYYLDMLDGVLDYYGIPLPTIKSIESNTDDD